MQIAPDAVVSIHYTLTDDAGETLDTSAGGEPLAYLHGKGNLITGLENALTGKGSRRRMAMANTTRACSRAYPGVRSRASAMCKPACSSRCNPSKARVRSP